MLFFEITLVYLGTLNQPINCPNSLNLASKTSLGLREVLPLKGTFPIGNLIPEPRLGFFKVTFFQKLWSHFFRVFFLVLFSLLK